MKHQSEEQKLREKIDKTLRDLVRIIQQNPYLSMGAKVEINNTTDQLLSLITTVREEAECIFTVGKHDHRKGFDCGLSCHEAGVKIVEK